MKHNSPDW